MKKENQLFEQKLREMTKPEVSELKHQELLGKALLRAKAKSVLSGWWLSVPLYVLVMFAMKSLFLPGTTLMSNLREMAMKHSGLTLMLFLILPMAFIIISVLSIRRIRFLSGSRRIYDLFKVAWFNLMIIALSLIAIVIYLLQILLT